MSFLDTTVILDRNTIHTDLYTKPTDTHQSLSPESCHPKRYTTSIPYSLKLQRICLRDEDNVKRTEDLKEHLRGRGYKKTTMDTQIQLDTQTPWEETMQPHPRRPALQHQRKLRESYWIFELRTLQGRRKTFRGGAATNKKHAFGHEAAENLSGLRADISLTLWKHDRASMYTESMVALIKAWQKLIGPAYRYTCTQKHRIRLRGSGGMLPQ